MDTALRADSFQLTLNPNVSLSHFNAARGLRKVEEVSRLPGLNFLKSWQTDRRSLCFTVPEWWPHDFILRTVSLTRCWKVVDHSSLSFNLITLLDPDCFSCPALPYFWTCEGIPRMFGSSLLKSFIRTNHEWEFLFFFFVFVLLLEIACCYFFIRMSVDLPQAPSKKE